jgi:hypothetical protein
MNFLSTLSEEKKLTPTKTTFIDNINPSNPSNNITSNNQVHIELPFELLENTEESKLIPIDEVPIIELPVIDNDVTQNIKYKPLNDVPYGCLKNGNKPTYRSWINKSTMNNKSTTHNETLKNYTNSNDLSLDREKKLNELKNKYFREKEREKEKEKTFIKRTIKKKYTLGKSDIKRKVGILIKNINTRKKVTDSHKELKTHEINDIKKYLRNRGLIRIGNTTPHDVLRKIYESSILSGDITNNNKDILLHNLLNE